MQIMVLFVFVTKLYLTKVSLFSGYCSFIETVILSIVINTFMGKKLENKYSY